jgi:hypothetical protein
MALKDFLNGILPNQKPHIYAPEMMLAMKNLDKERVKAMTIELLQTAQNLTKKDIGTWRAAWQMAINPENPQRRQLYGVYTDVCVDLHLSGCIDQREKMVLQKAFKLVNKNGKENKELSELFEAEWFKDFMNYVLDSRFWGHSLIQFGDILNVMGKKKFEQVELVPREHVVPEFGVITKEAGGDYKKGIDYRNNRIAEWCIEAGKPKDLGLLLKCSPHSLAKKNMLAFWDSFGEIFGMPIRVGETTSRDPKEIAKIEKMLDGMGAMPWGLFPEGTTIKLIETSRGDAFNVYDKRIDRANSEISKGILNQTMTIDSGSSYSQSEVHLQIFDNVVEADADFVRDVINNKLLPFMVMHGFPVDKHRFDWDETVEYTPEQMRTIEQMMLSSGYEIEPEYFVEKYNIPITGKKDPTSFFE